MVESLHARVHRRLVFDRRRDRLVGAIDALLPLDCSVLDIGCGNGEIGAALSTSGRTVVGVETLRRSSCEIPVVMYDGSRLPFANDVVDWAVIVDVLHHAAQPAVAVAEAARVARHGVIVKDHYAESSSQRVRLGVMDWVGNRQFGVGRDGHYLSRAEWSELWAHCGLRVAATEETLDLYPLMAKPFFERGLHFVTRLEPIAGGG